MVNTRLFKELRETAASTISSKKKTRFLSISEFLEFQITSSTKMRTDNQNTSFGRQVARWISFQVHPKRPESRRIQCVQRGIKTRKLRHGQHRAVRTWVKQSEQLSVLRAFDIPKKGQFTACVVSVWCPLRNKQRKSEIELTSSQILDPLYVVKQGNRGVRHGPD